MSLREAITGSPVETLDLTGYVRLDESCTVREAIRLMKLYDHTTVLVTRDNTLCGIFTERDVLRKVAQDSCSWERPVSAYMAPDPVTIRPAETVEAAVRRMNKGHFRDLPVVDARGAILGNLTDNAIVRHLCDYLQVEVLNLPPTPGLVAQLAEGA